MKHFLFTVLAFLLCYSSFGQITGATNICEGMSATYSDPLGGAWSSSNTAVATIDAVTGIATGVATGTAKIYCSSGPTTDSLTITVDPVPAPIVGPTSVCEGSTITLSDATPGGVWVTSTPALGTVDPTTGDFTGISAGSPTVSYELPATGCAASVVIAVNPLPTPVAVTGGGSYCSAGTGVSVGTGGSSAGVIYQLYVGGAPLGSPMFGTGAPLDFGPQTTAGIYTVVATDASTGCAGNMSGSATVTIIASPTSYTVAGGGNYCAGSTGVLVSLSGSQSGISYQLDSASVPVGIPIAGTGSAIAFGPITGAGVYTIEAAPGATCALMMSGSATVGIDPLPNIYSLTGGGSYCAGSAGLPIDLINTDLGTNYQLFLGATPVGSAVAGTGTGITFGSQTVAGTYTAVATDATTTCVNSMAGSAAIVINPVPSVFYVTGGGLYCTGGTPVNVGITGSQPGINYQAYVGTSAVGGTMPGTGLSLVIGGMTLAGTYTVVGADAVTGCTSNMSGSVVITTSTATVSASKSVACGGVNTLTASGSVSYTWSPATGLSCTACASPTVLPHSSVNYVVTGTNASGCTATTTVPVDGNSISGYFTYSGGSVTDLFKVWLIQYNPSDSSIIATDSMTSCMVGSAVPFYQFMDPAPGSYMVKAELLGGTPGASGYIPTYGSSSPYWYSASSVTHGSGADSMHINMIFGTVPVGPGFISGYVYAGAGKGTSGDAPDPGITVYLRNASTNQVLTYTQTDAMGHYSFGSLDYASYVIYPEDFKYHTVPSDVIRISPSNTSVSNINFRRSTTFGTITPKPAGIHSVPEQTYYIAPNPTSGDVSVTWPAVTGNAVINVTDLTGRTVYNETFSAGSGKAVISLADLQNGIYFIAVRTDNYNYGTKLLIQK